MCRLRQARRRDNEVIRIHTLRIISTCLYEFVDGSTLSSEMIIAAHRNISRFRSWTVRGLFLPRMSSMMRDILTLSSCISCDWARCGGNFSNFSTPVVEVSLQCFKRNTGHTVLTGKSDTRNLTREVAFTGQLAGEHLCAIRLPTREKR